MEARFELKHVQGIEPQITQIFADAFFDDCLVVASVILGEICG